jgi:hypothetical protein
MATFCMARPGDSIRMIFDVVGRTTRRALLEELTVAWVDEIPSNELSDNYAKALDFLDGSRLAEVAQMCGDAGVRTLSQRPALHDAFERLDEVGQREMVRVVAAFRALDAFDGGVSEDHVLDLVIPFLSAARLNEFLEFATRRYIAEFSGPGN